MLRLIPFRQLNKSLLIDSIIMDGAKALTELKQRSQKADEIIEKLKHQIEQIKLQTTPEFMAKRVVELKGENEKLKKRVEELKKELEVAEAGKPASKPLANVTNVESEKPKPAAAAAAKDEAKKEGKKEKEVKPKSDAAPAKKDSKEPPKVENIDVSKLDIRVGKIIECAKHPEADALYVEKIDLGEDKPRNVCSGLVKFIPLDQMQNRMVVVLCNLKPTKLRGVMSEAMVLCASTPEKVELMVPPANAAVGDRITAAGFDGEPVAEINQKNNIFGIVQPDLLTNADLVGTYKGVPLEIKGKGPIKSSTLKSVPIK